MTGEEDPATESERSDVEDIEIGLFVQALHQCRGYDFRDYAAASLRRRVLQLVTQLGTRTITGLTERMLHEEALLPQIVAGLSVPVSEMFRNPGVFRLLVEQVFPVLASYPQVNIWQAGCAHGEEAYSLAILLEEHGLYERTQIFATDFSDAALHRAAEGIFPVRELRQYSENYLAAGGRGSLADYYLARYDFVKLDSRLRRNITFAHHNLTSDGVFCEAHLVLCRNVLIYFTDRLQDRALALFRDSLVRGGFLCLGNRESLARSAVGRVFVPIDADARVFQLHRSAS